jgi:hypothetical protein
MRRALLASLVAVCAFAQAPTAGIVTTGTMVPILVSSTLTGQVAAISPTTIYTPAAAGVFRMCVSVMLTANGTGGNILFYSVANTTLGAGSTQQIPVSNVSTAAASNASGGGCVVVRVGAGLALQYLTIFNSVTGSPVYTIDITVEQLK